MQGRADEILRYQEADIHPLVLRSVLLASAEIADYQVRQAPGGMEVDVLCERPVDLDLLRGRLCSALTGAGLRDPDVHLRAVSSLTRNGETGKLRRFVPLDAS